MVYIVRGDFDFLARGFFSELTCCYFTTLVSALRISGTLPNASQYSNLLISINLDEEAVVTSFSVSYIPHRLRMKKIKMGLLYCNLLFLLASPRGFEPLLPP